MSLSRWRCLLAKAASRKSVPVEAEPTPCQFEKLEPRVLLSVTVDVDGWTHVTPSSDSRIIYVSSSLGDDSHSGLSEANAVATLARAVSLVRDNRPDWILFKRGDVWYEAFGQWDASGRSQQEPIYLSTYGDAVARPLIKTANADAFTTSINDDISNVIISGLHLYSHTRDPSSPEFISTSGGTGFRWRANGSNLVLEDMVIQSYTTNLIVEPPDAFNNLRVVRSHIVDAYSTSGHSHGAFIHNVHGITMEYNTFDHNGWNEHIVGAEKTIFNHNVYIQVTSTGLTARFNIFARASSHGLQARYGGVINNNTFVRNPIAMSVGLVRGGAVDNGLVPPNGVFAHVKWNVIINSDDISETHPRGIGLELGNLNFGHIAHNIFTSESSAGDGSIAILMEGDLAHGLRNVTLEHNTIYDWQGGLRVRGQALEYENVEFSNNAIQNLDHSKPLMRFDKLFPVSSFAFESNTYDSPRSKWFQIEFETFTYEQWKWIVADLSDTAQITYVDPQRSMESYGVLKGTPTLNAFLLEVRENTRPLWISGFSGAAFNNYIRAGFQQIELTAVEPVSARLDSEDAVHVKSEPAPELVVEPAAPKTLRASVHHHVTERRLVPPRPLVEQIRDVRLDKSRQSRILLQPSADEQGEYPGTIRRMDPLAR